MTRVLPVAAVLLALPACSKPPKPSAPATSTESASAAPAKITQFYTTTPSLPRGESGLLCYGVENAKAVWLSPPRQSVAAALTRCVEISPTATTTYTLTAEGAAGPPAKMDLTIEVGPPHAKIVEVEFTTLNLKRGEVVGICYKVQNAKNVEISPIGYRGKGGRNCTTDRPLRTTTYTVTAIGPAGDRDQEQATVQVR